MNSKKHVQQYSKYSNINVSIKNATNNVYQKKRKKKTHLSLIYCQKKREKKRI